MPFIGLLLSLLPTQIYAGAGTSSWSLSSPNGQCAISVSLGRDGRLSYQTFRTGKKVLGKSPLGLRRDDQDFEGSLAFDDAGEIERRREHYELFAGGNPCVDHFLNHRSLTFHNNNHASLVIDLAASDEGVAFRYRFMGKSGGVHVVESEATGFELPPNARGWLQPYHAAGPYTPAYEDFYFHVSPGDMPPDSRQKAVGWAFPALFNVPGARVWLLLTESGTDESYCACHFDPDSSGGLYQIAFPRADETTRGYTNQFGPQPRRALPW